MRKFIAILAVGVVLSFAGGGAPAGASNRDSPPDFNIDDYTFDYDDVSTAGFDVTVNNILDLLMNLLPLDPVTGTVAAPLLDAENAGNIKSAIDAAERSGQTGSTNVNEHFDYVEGWND
ncbi:MAG: hypothetical protein O3A85_06055 [Proteobacteria bacterium]|nr:hypothetical protein [Pseudomonadota bacterium]